MFAEASVLRRRRVSAAYRVHAARYKSAGARTLAVLLLISVLTFPLFRWDAPPRADAISRALPLKAPTAAQTLDRFTVDHRVTTGDSISQISLRYYRAWSPGYDKLLREANPDLPGDPRQLTTSIVVKVPLR